MLAYWPLYAEKKMWKQERKNKHEKGLNYFNKIYEYEYI